MNKKLIILGLVLCLLISANAKASSQIELSPLLMNNGATNSAVQKTTTATKPAYYNNNVQTSKNTLSMMNTKNDLPISRRVEKTENTPFYHNQSNAELQDLVQKVGYNLLKANSIQQSVQFVYDDAETVNANVNVNNRVKVYKGLIKNVTMKTN